MVKDYELLPRTDSTPKFPALIGKIELHSKGFSLDTIADGEHIKLFGEGNPPKENHNYFISRIINDESRIYELACTDCDYKTEVRQKP